MPEFLTESGVNPEGEPFVNMTWGKEKGQFTPDETRTFALGLLVAAEAALHDAAFLHWLQEGPLSLDLPRAARLMSEQRQYRADLQEE